tara:strand:+ start:297 stop:551 length:255 start_codon:yes stop_codon:yes gene_type:complete
MDAGIPPFEHEELELLPNNIRVEIDHYRKSGREPKMLCAWVDSDMRCSKYEHRPKLCRDFEVGGRGCRASRLRYGFDGLDGSND